MICNHCGMTISDSSRFCQFCGSPIQEEPSIHSELTLEPTQDTQYSPVQESPFVTQDTILPPIYDEPEPIAPMYTPVSEQIMFEEEPAVPDDGNVLKWGILGIAFAQAFPINILGLIFSIIARKKSNAYLAYYGKHSAKERVGRIFGTIGIPLSIGLTVFFLVYFTILILFIYFGIKFSVLQ